MKLTLAILFIVLGACAPHSQGLTTDARAETSSPSARLEAKIDRLTSLVESMQNERASRVLGAQNYLDCDEKCTETYPWRENDKSQDDVRAECFKSCEKIKPIGMSPEC